MNVNWSVRNRMLLAAGFVLAAALVVVSCSSGGGGGGAAAGGGTPPPPPPPPAATFLVFNSPQQAAATTSAALSARSAADSVFNLAIDLGLTGKLTAGIGSLYKPARPAANLGGLDPALAGMADIMKISRLSPVIRKVVLRKAAMAPTSVSTVLTTGFCDNADGQITITGQNNYQDIASTSLAYTYDVAFTKCRDDITFTQLDGTLHVVYDESIATAALIPKPAWV